MQVKKHHAFPYQQLITGNFQTKNILQQHWPLLKIDPTFAETFQQTPTLAFRRNRYLKDTIGTNKKVKNSIK